MGRMFMYVGTLGRRDGRAAGFSASCRGGGVYAFAMEDGGELSPLGFTEGIETSMLAVASNGRTLYSTNECRDFAGDATGGGVSAYRIDPSNGTLTPLGGMPALGACTAYISMSVSGRYLLAANHGSHTDAVCGYVPDGHGGFALERRYDTPSVAVFRLRGDGSIEGASDLVTFSGAGSHWPAPFIHSVNIDSENLVYVCNKGRNAVELMRLDEETGRLALLHHCEFRPGTSPRHSALSELRPLLYVCNEMEPSVTVYRIDRGAGRLCDVQTLSTLRETETRPGFGPSDIALHPGERFLYVSTRGVNTITVYHVGEDGLLETSSIFDCGRNPRGFRIDPSGRFLAVGYMDDDRVAVLEIDPSDGSLREAASAEVPSPASVRFVEVG